MVLRMSRANALALAAVASAASSAGAFAATTFDDFTPLSGSVPAGSLPEWAPLQLSNPAWSQVTIADRTTQLGLGQFNSGNWDMITADETGPSAGRYLFTVFETGQAGIQRTDLQANTATTIWQSPAASPALNSHVAFDACYWTPWGTFVTAEESWGAQPQPYGRLYEVTNPLAAPGSVTNVHRNVVPRVSHEGIQWDAAGNMYFIDELNGGSIYKYTSQTPNGATFFDAGQTSVLRVGTGSVVNATGAATWVPFTDTTGAGLPGAVVINDPNGVTAVDGRATTDLAGFKGTDYHRPEDLQIQMLPNGQQVLYFATTTTHEVYSMNLATGIVNLFGNRNTIDAATGLPVGSAFTNPDNLAMDADGNIYVIEDQPGGSADIWFGVDADHDGIAESFSRWASLSTIGAEPTGLYFDPFDPDVAYINVQHPSSGVDRTIRIVPEPSSALAGSAGILLATRKRRRARRR